MGSETDFIPFFFKLTCLEHLSLMKNHSRIAVIIGWLFLLACQSNINKTNEKSAPAPDDKPKTSVQQALQITVDSLFQVNSDARGLMVMLTDNMDSKAVAAAGYSDSLKQEALNDAAPMIIASCTKTYVAAAVMVLVENRRMNLEQPLNEVLSSETLEILRNGGYRTDKITIRQLLSHTSGIGDYTDTKTFMDRVVNDSWYKWSRQEQIQLAMAEAPEIGKPGEQFIYADTNYLLLTEALEKATGQVFYEAMRTLLQYHKHNFTETWFLDLESAPSHLSPICSHHYGAMNMSTDDFDHSFDIYGGGGIATTMREFNRFHDKLFNGELFSKQETIGQMIEKQVLLSGDSVDYGLGIMHFEIGGRNYLGHGGFWGTLAAYDPIDSLIITSFVVEKDQTPLKNELIQLAHQSH